MLDTTLSASAFVARAAFTVSVSALGANRPSTSDLVYVVDLSALSAVSVAIEPSSLVARPITEPRETALLSQLS